MAKVNQTQKEAAKATVPPVTANKPAKPAKSKRSAHPSVGNTDTNVYPFKALPADYVFGKMTPLKKKDFATETAFYEYRAAEMDAKAATFRTMAENAKKGGGNTAKKLVKLQEKMSELRAQLEAQGIDVNEMLKTLTTKAE